MALKGDGLNNNSLIFICLTDEHTFHMNLIKNIAVVLAHTLMCEKEIIYPSRHCSSFVNGGDPPAPAPAESTALMLEAYSKYLPQLMRSSSAQILPNERALLQASKEVSPQYAALQNEIMRKNALNNAETDRQVMAGPGRSLVEQGLGLSKIADPEYYSVRANTGKQLNDLLGSFNLDGLSNGEAAAAERGINRNNFAGGRGNNTSQLTTVGNAMNFGNAFNQKRANLTNAIGAATGFLGNGAKSGVDVFQQAVGRPSTAFTGAPQPQVGASANAFGMNLLGQTGQFQQGAMDINANRRDSWDRTAQAFNSL